MEEEVAGDTVLLPVNTAEQDRLDTTVERRAAREAGGSELDGRPRREVVVEDMDKGIRAVSCHFGRRGL
jgi:hypothetical protein